MSKRKEKPMPISHKVQLMTYPDSLGGNLKTLKQTLDTYLSQAVGLVHILPFYPSSGDRGFAPLTHMEVEPEFGTWEDIKAIAHTYDVQSDLVVGHMSVYSPEFQDYLKHGLNSKYADMFAALEKTFPNKTITLDELTKFDELTPIPPIIVFELGDGTKRPHFKTFLPMQADLDPMSPLTWEYYEKFVKHLSEQGISMIRLDAVGTIYKHPELGMNMVPETYEILQKLIDLIHSYDMEVLTEIHSDLETKKRIVEMGAWTYDFHLPARIFQAILTRDVTGLEEWYQICPKNQIAVLTNHDGINVTSEPEYVGSEEAAEVLAGKIIQNAGYSTKAASGLTSQNVSIHSINATLLEACFRDQNQWLMAHVLQLFAPGIPQVYYNDLLAQRNDEERWHETGEGRELVRHNHPESQIDHKFNQPFVQKVIRVMEFRSNYPAFQGSVEVLASDPTEFHVVWTNTEYKAVLHADMDSWLIKITYYNPDIKEFQTLDLE
mgnify:CR=1 FL=1